MTYTFRFEPVFAHLDYLVSGLITTLWVSGVVFCAGLLIGICGAMAMRSSIAPLRILFRVYVELIRNTPILAQIFFIFFGLAGIGLRLGSVPAGLIALSIYLGAYTTEIVRGGLDAIPRGQTDAGFALGLTARQVFFYVTLKPALKTMFPALASQMTLLMLATSVLSQIGIEELLRMAARIDSETFRSFETYAVTCLVYLVLALTFRAICAVIYRLVFDQRLPDAVPSAKVST